MVIPVGITSDPARFIAFVPEPAHVIPEANVRLLMVPTSEAYHPPVKPDPNVKVSIVKAVVLPSKTKSFVALVAMVIWPNGVGPSIIVFVAASALLNTIEAEVKLNVALVVVLVLQTVPTPVIVHVPAPAFRVRTLELLELKRPTLTA
jgi:hypothetical protein